MSQNLNERRSKPRGGYDRPIKDEKQKWGKNTLEPFTIPFDTPQDDVTFKMGKNRVFEWVEITQDLISEDLAVWFGTKKKPKGSKQPKGPWVNICRKVDGKHPPCGRPDADSKGYPKCRAAGVAGKMSDSEKKSACAQKRTAEKKNPKTGKGNKPTMTSYKPKKKKPTKEQVLENLIQRIVKTTF
jgi:hypothetical protein